MEKELSSIELKILNKEELEEKELSRIPYACNVIKQIDGDAHRWQREKSVIFEIQGRCFRLDYMEGLTEMQEDDFYDQPYEVIKEKKTIVVTDWVAKE